MKTAGDILSALFDERFMQKAKGYSKLFDSWKDITEKNGIASAAGHSRIRELDRGILLVETDHPGWKQILQTKQSKILNDFRIRFPELDISGISLILGKVPMEENESIPTEEEPHLLHNTALKDKTNQAIAAEITTGKESYNKNDQHVERGYDAIKDKELRDKLIKIGQSIEEEEKK
ncbi:MAG: DUF721 domain-containing protein [Treponema sp.]|nr:DUF721 domain-containing protein [Treponema sp.]